MEFTFEITGWTNGLQEGLGNLYLLVSKVLGEGGPGENMTENIMHGTWASLTFTL